MYINYGVGRDNEICGNDTSPCGTIPYAMGRASSGVEILLLNSTIDIPTFSCSLPALEVGLTGMSEFLGGVDVYPQIFMDYSQVSIFNFTQRCRATLKSFRVLVNASANQQMRFFFYQDCNGGTARVTFEFVFTRYFRILFL
jgi:hypothetical protein